MKGIKGLYKKHKGKEIYVVCSGASLNGVSPDFFKDKITVGVNHVYRKYNTTYLVGKEPQFYKKAFIHLKSKKKVIEYPHILITEKRNGNFKHGNNSPRITPQEKEEFKISIFVHKDNKRHLIDVRSLNTSAIVSWSSVTTAMHIASYMGASKVILCGHDCCTIGGKRSFDGYHINIKETPWKKWSEYVSWLSKIKSQTEKAAYALYDYYGCTFTHLDGRSVKQNFGATLSEIQKLRSPLQP